MTDAPRVFRALRLLEKECPPLLHGHEPFWHPKPSPASAEALIPSWTWRHLNADLIPEGDRAITIDINGAYLAALGAVQVAHGALVHKPGCDPHAFAGPRFETSVWPGYYRITVPRWSCDATLVSPLGNSARLQTETDIWVAHPTLVLLLELLDEGSIGPFEITEAWVADDNRRCDFRQWSGRLRAARDEYLDARIREHGATIPEGCTCDACTAYKAFKVSYGQAFSMMLTGEKSKTHRPDWAHAVYAQHAAAAWRKAWRLTLDGTVLSMGAVDEITVLNSTLVAAIQRTKPPVQWDPTGRKLGSVKEKEKDTAAAAAPAAPAPADPVVADVLETEDWGSLL